jgi:hypothetical protein
MFGSEKRERARRIEKAKLSVVRIRIDGEEIYVPPHRIQYNTPGVSGLVRQNLSVVDMWFCSDELREFEDWRNKTKHAVDFLYAGGVVYAMIDTTIEMIGTKSWNPLPVVYISEYAYRFIGVPVQVFKDQIYY